MGNRSIPQVILVIGHILSAYLLESPWNLAKVCTLLFKIQSDPLRVLWFFVGKETWKCGSERAGVWCPVLYISLYKSENYKSKYLHVPVTVERAYCVLNKTYGGVSIQFFFYIDPTAHS